MVGRGHGGYIGVFVVVHAAYTGHSDWRNRYSRVLGSGSWSCDYSKYRREG